MLGTRNMYIKWFTYIWFAVLFMWLGSIVSNLVSTEIDHVSVDHEELVATTSSYTDSVRWFMLPGVFIMIPKNHKSELSRWECYEK